MIRQKQAFTTLFGALLAFSCGGVSKSQHSETTESGGSAGTGNGGSAGDIGSGGSAGNASGGNPGGSAGIAMGASSGTSGNGGSGLGGASGGTAGKGGRGSVPGETPNERDILEPLGTDDATIEAASGKGLVDLVHAIGFAQGYALCRCFFSPEMPPVDQNSVLDCAQDESLGVVSTPDRARCIAERMGEVPGFEGYLRCVARSMRDYGLDWSEVCTNPDSMPEVPLACAAPPETDSLIHQCEETIYCPDGARVVGHRCDTLPDCPSLADERNCYELVGRDQLLCGDAITFPSYFCSEPACADIAICDPDALPRFRCADGIDVDANAVCDRVKDCRDGTDETACLR